MPLTDTSIGSIQQDEYYLRGQRISQLILQADWIGCIWLTWTGRIITSSERVLLSACLVACIDHGADTPSTQRARLSAGTGKHMGHCLRDGLQVIDERHGNAATPAAHWLQRAMQEQDSLEERIEAILTKGERLPGFGHRVYAIDPRSVALLELAKQRAFPVAHLEFAFEVSHLLSQKKGTPLPLNVDGAVGALVLDLGLPASFADVLFLVARTVGLTAHILEEQGELKGVFTAPDSSVSHAA